MSQGAKAVSAGRTGRLLRLVFAASVAGGSVGAFIAMIVPIDQVHPVHDRLVGLAVMGIATGASLVAVAAIRLAEAKTPPRRGEVPRTGSSIYLGTYLLFAVTGLTVLSASAEIRQIVDWTRSPVRVSATSSACTSWQVSSEFGTGTQYSCDVTWTWDGVEHRQENVNSTAAYPSGRVLSVWVNPSDGGSDDHSVSTLVVLSLACLLSLGAAAFSWYYSITESSGRPGFRAWLAGRA